MAWILIIFALIFYFAPAIQANHRRHKNRAAIFMLNLFLGWTFLGWVVAIVWAYTSNVEETKEPTTFLPSTSGQKLTLAVLLIGLVGFWGVAIVSAVLR